MRIRIEPREFFMYTVFLAFNNDEPDPEDQEIKAYLDQRRLLPKVQGTDTLEDKEVEVMVFGGCYLGGHLKVLGGMQQRAVRRQMLEEEIGCTLTETTDAVARQVADSTPAPELKELFASLAQQLDQESTFGPDPNSEGFVKVILESAVIQQSFLEMVEGRVQSR